MPLSGPASLGEEGDIERQWDPHMKFTRERWSITGTQLGYMENTIWEFDVDFEAKGDRIDLRFTPVGIDEAKPFTISISLAAENKGRDTQALRDGIKRPIIATLSTHTPITPIECWAIGAYEVSIMWAERNLPTIGVSTLFDFGVDQLSPKATVLKRHGFTTTDGPYLTYMKAIPPQEGEAPPFSGNGDAFKVFVPYSRR